MEEMIKTFGSEFKEEFLSIKKEGLKKQIPNILTFSRAIAPIIIIPTILSGFTIVAIIELIIFALTDFLDGKLARKFDCVSHFGIKLDAVCDKIFALGLMIPAIIKYPLLIINLVLEGLISYVNILSEAKNNHPRSNIIGKIKTLFLSVTLVLSYIINMNYKYIRSSSIITFILQVWALIKYKKIDISKDNKKK